MHWKTTVLVLLVAGGAPQLAPAPKVANPFAAHAFDVQARYALQGRVVERVRAGHYVYLRLEQTGLADTWLVSLAVTTPETADVRALVLGRADHFHSQRLARDFSPLLFAAVRAGHSQPKQP